MHPGSFVMGVDRKREPNIFPFAFVRRDDCPEVVCMGGLHLDLKYIKLFGE